MATKPKKKQARGGKAAGAAAKPKAAGRRAGTAKAGAKGRASAKSKPKAKKAPARAGAAARGKSKGLDLRGLWPNFTVGDLEQSIRLYVDGLGFKVEERWEHGGKLTGVTLDSGGFGLGLSQDDWAKGRDRVKGVGFRVYAETGQDLDALAERVRAHGFEVDGPKKETWGGTTVTVTDPDGFKLTFHGKMS